MLFINTSRWTSFATFSTVPGLDRPSASLRAWNEAYVSLMVDTRELFDKPERGPDCGFSDSVDDWST